VIDRGSNTIYLELEFGLIKF